jgi:glycine/D-amino acid oxidase-like deaminating enzyme
MPVLRLARPVWLDRTLPFQVPTYPALAQRLDVDVAIIGAGVTGAAVAWRFAASGLRVAVLEAARAGRGSTAASTALLMQEPDEDFSELRARYGARPTRRIWELSRLATRDFVRTLRRLNISCNLAARDSIYYTLEQESAARIRREHESRRRAGLQGTWLDRAALRKATGIEGAAAIRTHGNAQLDPYKACLGLLRAAEACGARTFERSPVRRIDAERTHVTVTSTQAKVRASHVVVATGYATAEFKPLLARFRMMNTYVVATEPLSLATRAELGLSDVMLWDTERPYHYARWTEDNRLLLGGADRPLVTGNERHRAFAEGVAAVRQYFNSVFPALRQVKADHAWEGLFAQTPDGLPYIGPHRRYPRHLFALGYGGNGMTFGFLASKLLLERLNGLPSRDQDLFAFGRAR